jgi:soluble lytic murein transglycosylase
VVRRHWYWIALALVLVDGLGLGWWLYQRREHSQDAVIVAAARRYGVEPALVKAVVWRESWFDPHARGRAGELGLMQLREPAAREWAAAERLGGFQFAHLLDPSTNTMAGAWYLRKLLGRYTQADQPVVYALADYNAGRGHVLRWNRGAAATNSQAFLLRMDFPGTRDYVGKTVRRAARYRLQFAEQGDLAPRSGTHAPQADRRRGEDAAPRL